MAWLIEPGACSVGKFFSIPVRDEVAVHQDRGTGDEDGGAGVAPDVQIDAGVPGVDIILRAEAAVEFFALGAAAVIARAVAADHFVEYPKMIGDGAGDGLIGAGGEHEPAPKSVLLAEIFQEPGVIGEGGDVEASVLGEAALEGGAAGEDPDWQHEQMQRMAAGEIENRFDEGIGAKKRSIQIDDQREGGFGVGRLGFAHGLFAELELAWGMMYRARLICTSRRGGVRD